MDLDSVKQRAKAFDHLFDALVIVDLEGIITDWNKGSEKLYGYTKEEAVGKPVSILHVPEDVDRVTQEVMSSVEKTGKWTGEIKMLHKDGHVGWIESMCIPFFDNDGNSIGALGVNRDITKRIEDELALKESQKKLKNEVDVKDRFFSIIAHDLNGPYNHLLGLTSMLAQDSDSFSKEEVVQHIQKVHQAAQQVYNLQKDLLEWSRSQFKAGDVAAEQISLHGLVEDTIEVLKFMTTSKNLTLVNQIDDEKIFADPNMVQTVIRNLVSNAVKFSHQGGEVVLSSKRKEDVVEITVSDNGVGIPKDQLDNIFDLDNLTSGVGTAGEKGSGIGMSLCREMIEKNGGKIWLNSVVGEGTQVTFSLPIQTS